MKEEIESIIDKQLDEIENINEKVDTNIIERKIINQNMIVENNYKIREFLKNIGKETIDELTEEEKIKINEILNKK